MLLRVCFPVLTGVSPQPHFDALGTYSSLPGLNPTPKRLGHSETMFKMMQLGPGGFVCSAPVCLVVPPPDPLCAYCFIAYCLCCPEWGFACHSSVHLWARQLDATQLRPKSNPIRHERRNELIMMHRFASGSYLGGI